MDSGGELVIAIGKRAKQEEREADGYASSEEPEGEESSGDTDEIMESAAADVAAALGVDPEKVDSKGLAMALCDLMEAHSLSKGKGK